MTDISKMPQCVQTDVSRRTYKCFDCVNYDVKTGKTRGSVDRICNAIKNDPRLIVDLGAPKCNDYKYFA